jgi:hypothetical protein
MRKGTTLPLGWDGEAGGTPRRRADESRDVLVLFAFVAGYTVLLVGVVVFWLKERR